MYSDAGVASIAGVLCVNNSIQLLQSEVEQNRQSVLVHFYALFFQI
jgi:hypothetical protein